MPALLKTLAQFVAPIALLGAAFVLVYYSAALPPSLSGLKVYGPYFVFLVGAALALGFNRGRALFALVTLVIAYAAQQWWLQKGLASLPARAVYAALTVFVPLNLALLAVVRERGIFNLHGVARLTFIAAQVVLTAWVLSASQTGIADWAYQKFLDAAPFSAGRIPQFAAAVIGLGVLTAMAATLATGSALAAAFAGAIVAFAVAAHVPNASVSYSIFIAAAELMVTVAVLQDTFRMAFRDELTGLPSRRALNERLAGLGSDSDYAVAMIDVDHFKGFNDTYGHDTGDQVLRLVAAHIDQVGGGGLAYRYGGEEFTVLFPGKVAEEALPHLEALREEIESYRMALRGGDRPRKRKGARRQRGGWRDKNTVSVTVSIGVAESDGRLDTPQAVIEAADRALYRAKGKGRNLVSR
jgi:diguanylate cyclase (GGDEF)-like protein